AGIGNTVPGGENGAGTFHVYNSKFSGSATADIGYGYAGVQNFVNNYSIGSNRFMWMPAGTGGSNSTLAQRKIILDTTKTLSIQQQDRGPLILLDNVIRSAAGNTYSPSTCDGFGEVAGTCPVVMLGSYSHPSETYDLFSMGNTYTLGSGTCSNSSPAVVTGRCHSVQDQIIPYASVNPTAPTLPGTPPNLGRTVFEASPTGSGTTCSAA